MIPHLTSPLADALVGAAEGALNSMPKRSCMVRVAARLALLYWKKMAQFEDAPQ
jgi:hypothetical protein